MPDYFEIDFLDVETGKSGDAIVMRYQIGGYWDIHIVDGGFADMGQKIVDHMWAHYAGFTGLINNVVVTHPDGDHVCGLRYVLEHCQVHTLWMMRPWLYAEVLLPYFENYNYAGRLRQHLRQAYPYIADLEVVAIERGIPIEEPLQGKQIGAFRVLAPSLARWAALVIQSEKTPESSLSSGLLAALTGGAHMAAAKLWNLVTGNWGQEVFSANETSSENEMSVIQYAQIADRKIVLTGDAGRGALAEAADFALNVGLHLPGVDRFQVPHHGSRRNVSTELLDRWLGPRLAQQLPDGEELFLAICSSAKADKAHPRKSVIRAFIHRGGRFITTEEGDVRTKQNAPERPGWSTAAATPYPSTYEE